MSNEAEGLVRGQHELHGRIARTMDNLRKAGLSKITSGTIDTRLRILDAHWEKFEAAHELLRSTYWKAINEDEYVRGDLYGSVEETYSTQRAALVDLRTEMRTQASEKLEASIVREVEGPSRKQLPRMQLPNFSGKFEEWPTFKDLFRSIIHRDPTLSEVERLHYLRTCLKGEAEQLVRNVPTTADNYERVWSMLTERYENERLLVRACFSSFTALPKMKTESTNDLRRLFHGMLQTVGSLEGIGRSITDCDLFVHLIVEMLDPRSRREWETAISGTTKPPSYHELKAYLESRLRTLEALNPGTTESSAAAAKSGTGTRTARTHLAQRTTSKCSLCSKEHYILSCPEFQQKTPLERKQLAATQDLCLNCFGRHRVNNCPSKKSCAACKKRHHSSIHDACNVSGAGDGKTTPTLHARGASKDRAAVLLATARVEVTPRYGSPVSVRALIDSGSEVSLATECLVQRLRLPRTAACTAICGVGGQQMGVARGRVVIDIKSRVSGETIRVNALVLPRITAYRGRARGKKESWPHLLGLPLADPEFQASDAIELLLGADVYATIVKDGLRKGDPNAPIAQRTSLGWILSGLIGGVGPPRSAAALQCSTDDRLNELVIKFWRQEEPPQTSAPWTEQERQCEEFFVRTHRRLIGGRYEVRLPVASTLPTLADSRRAAVRTLEGMERKFTKEPRFHALYAEFLEEYGRLHHMEPVPPTEINQRDRVCYLPHHGVLKGVGAEQKIRVVFNGSTQLASGASLNSGLLTGPNLLPALADVLLRWRQHRFAMASDIEKMYRQVSVHPDDRDLQRIVWRPHRDGPRREYRLCTVTYGLTCAPYLAIRTLHQLAADEATRYPLGSATLRRDVYVDDILTGASTLGEVQLLQEQLIRLCEAGGFPLRKWATNCRDLSARIPEEHRQQHGPLEWDMEKSHSTLGLQWHPRQDVFGYRVRPCGHDSVSKRVVMSETARLFDPLGWLAPVVVRAKILVQSLWMQRIDWDQPLNEEDAREWQEFREELPRLERVRVPRWLRTEGACQRVEIHGFADASERAYAAVVYVRVKNDDNHAVTLLTAKTRVAPLRQVSLPRLELCAAVLLVRIVEHARATLGMSDQGIHLWSDSTVALAWIRGHPTKWTTFVANRVAEIQRALPDALWHHVPGSQNPADCASRGISPTDLVRHPLWWSGPAWLGEGKLGGSDIEPTSYPEGDLPERRARVLVAVAAPEESPFLLRMATLQKLLRVTAWCRRWLSAIRARGHSVSGALTTVELEEAERAWVLVVQADWFGEELLTLATGRPLPRKSTLLRLTPVVDERGVLRVGGRLKHAALDHDSRHQAILPNGSHLARLMVDACHRRTLHGGVQLTLSTLRQRYWLPSGRSAVKQHLHRCLPCVRWRAASPSPLMGSLPPPRVRASRPFTHTGVDYAGPIMLRAAKGRGRTAHKGFLAIFVCLATRTVHLEVASDYTTEAFLAAFRRFTARRGRCSTLYSDRGTNFVGADAQLRGLFRDASRQDHIIDALSGDGVQWRFNPPAAPHFGGIWEAAVKATKHHLRRVIGDATLTFEELSTVLAQVEACLNSRPLSALTDDPEDTTALTPGHFLIGDALIAIPEPSQLEKQIGLATRWKLLQRMTHHFWDRWSREYLHTLTTRPKWCTTLPNLRVGDLCLIRGETTPPTKWPLARITKVHAGEDGQVRVATVRTAVTTLQRPVCKLIPLGVRANENA